MHDTSVRSTFYPCRLTGADLEYLSILSSRAIYDCDIAGRNANFWRFVFGAALTEMAQRAADQTAITQGRTPAEKEPLEMPLWRGAELGDALLQAHSFVYLSLSPAVAAFGDWACLMLVCSATTQLKSYEEAIDA